jgi:Ni,Fe-hydrogenase III component G
VKDREEIVAKIHAGLGSKAMSSHRPVPNRLYVTVGPKTLTNAVQLLFDELSGRYIILTGVDTPHGIEVLYHFSFDEAALVVTLRVLLDPKKPEIESITPIVKGAEWIEREIHELLGVDFPGHPNMRRLVLAEDWPDGVYPLRRSYQQDKA